MKNIITAPKNAMLVDYLIEMFGERSTKLVEAYWCASQNSCYNAGVTNHGQTARDCFVKIITPKFRFFSFNEYVGFAKSEERWEGEICITDWSNISMKPMRHATFFTGGIDPFRKFLMQQVKKYKAPSFTADKAEKMLSLLPAGDIFEVADSIQTVYEQPFKEAAGDIAAKSVKWEDRRNYFEEERIRTKFIKDNPQYDIIFNNFWTFEGPDAVEAETMFKLGLR